MDERRRRVEAACAQIETARAGQPVDLEADDSIKADAESTSDNRDRLLYDVLDAIGTLGQLLREERSEFLKRKGAELIALWRRGEHLGVLREERP